MATRTGLCRCPCHVIVSRCCAEQDVKRIKPNTPALVTTYGSSRTLNRHWCGGCSPNVAEADALQRGVPTTGFRATGHGNFCLLPEENRRAALRAAIVA